MAEREGLEFITRQASRHAAVEAAVRAASGWQPIETAPKDGTALLLWAADTTRCLIGFWVYPRSSRTPGYWCSRPGNWQFRPSHWLTLPNPPLPDTPAASAATKADEARVMNPNPLREGS